jgi:hypothetical protein
MRMKRLNGKLESMHYSEFDEILKIF